MVIAPLWHATLRALQDWWNDNCLRLAASLAYYTALSLAPLVLLIVGVIGLLILGLMIWRSRKLFTRRARKTKEFSAHLAAISGQVEERGS